MKEAFSSSHDGIRLRAYDFVSQRDITLRLYVAQEEHTAPHRVVLNVLGEGDWQAWLARSELLRYW